MAGALEICGSCDPRFAEVERAFFWGGWGGSLVVIDLDAHLSFSYVMNKMGYAPMGDPRPFGPAAALYRGL